MGVDRGDAASGRKIAAVLGGIAGVLALFVGVRWGIGNQDPNIPVPMPPMPNPNAYTIFLQAARLVREPKQLDKAFAPASGRNAPSVTLAEKERLVNENEPAFRLVEQGLSVPYQAPPIRSFSQLMPYLGEFRGLARALKLRGDVLSERGDWGGAMAGYLDAMELGESVPRGSSIIGQLVGIACQAIGRKGAWQAVDHLSASDLRTATARMIALEQRHYSWSDSLQEEKWSGVAGLQEVFRRPGGLGSLLSNSSGVQAENRNEGSRVMTAILVGKSTVVKHYMQYMDALIANAKLPYTAHPADPPIPSDPINQILCPVFNVGRFKELEGVVLQNALLKTTLALHLYRREHAAYPARLEDLTPRYLDSVPADPFARAGTLRYRRRGAGYLLYSIGPDGVDNGGRPVMSPRQGRDNASIHRVESESTGDIVAGINTQ